MVPVPSRTKVIALIAFTVVVLNVAVVLSGTVTLPVPASVPPDQFSAPPPPSVKPSEPLITPFEKLTMFGVSASPLFKVTVAPLTPKVAPRLLKVDDGSKVTAPLLALVLVATLYAPSIVTVAPLKETLGVVMLEEPVSKSVPLVNFSVPALPPNEPLCVLLPVRLKTPASTFTVPLLSNGPSIKTVIELESVNVPKLSKLFAPAV